MKEKNVFIRNCSVTKERKDTGIFKWRIIWDNVRLNKFLLKSEKENYQIIAQKKFFFLLNAIHFHFYPEIHLKKKVLFE